MSTEMQTKVQASPAQNFMPAQTGLLQRKPALCNTPSLVEDSGRDKEKLTLQRSLVDQAGTTMVPRFGHDFSRVSVHSTGPGMIQTKLKINKPGDSYEQEADRVSEQVMRMEESRVQRQVEPEEEERLQAKPLANQITPLVQVQREEQPEEEEQIQPKPVGDQVAQAVLSNHSIVNPKNSSTNRLMHTSRHQGHGTSMAANERQYFEDRFGQDFSHIQIHRDAYARQLTTSLGTQAFAYGDHLYFNNSVYLPFTPEGRRIISHELAHTIQQAEARQLKVQCWPASIHQTITQEVVNDHFAGELSSDALLKLAFYAGQLDQRGCNYLYYAQDFILAKAPIIGPIIKSPSIPILSPILSLFTSKLSDYEAPNHGEANLYKYPGTKTEENEKRMNKHLAKALSLISKNGFTKQAMVYWGMALHVGQDRGSHQEGSKGKGHDRKKDDQGQPWNCDNPNDNPSGYIVAMNNTKALIQNFIKPLTPTQKKTLKTITFGKLAGSPGPHVGTIPDQPSLSLPKDQTTRRFVYVTLMKRMVYGEDGMPKRLLGMLPLMMKLGLGITGEHRKMLTTEPQVGLRVTKPTPLSYIGVFTGPSIGVGLDHKQAAFGWSLAAQLGLIGEQGDLNIMINQSWTTLGNSMVLGLSGTFDENRIIEKLFGK